MAPSSLSALGYDVQYQICVCLRDEAIEAVKKYWMDGPKHVERNALKNLSRTSRYFRYVAAPVLFKAMTITGEWDILCRKIETMGSSNNLMTHVKRCNIRGWFRWENLGRETAPEGYLPRYTLPDLPRELAQAINKMDHLAELGISMPVSQAHLLKEAFASVVSLMKYVADLKRHPDPCYEFVIASCPNVQSIATFVYKYKEYVPGFIEAAGRAPKLTRFALCAQWTVKLLDSVLLAMPGLTSLSMPGQYSDSFEAMAPLLPRFANLQRLMVGGVYEIRMTHVRPSRCGNSYRGSYGEQRRLEVQKAGEDVAKKVTEMLFPACKQLTLLWIGNRRKVEAIEAENGDLVELKWTEEGSQRTQSMWV